MALAACALWLVGVEAMPALHEALHDQLAPHRHDHGSIVTVSFEDTTHRHPDGTIHYVAPRARTARKPARDGRSHVTTGDTTHADGLAHHAAALLPAPPPVTHPLPIDRRPRPLAPAPSILLVTCDPRAATARGPPVA